MANYFYYDQTNQKQGPVSREELQELAAQGIINPDTQIELSTGDAIIARLIPGLDFSVQPKSTSTNADIGFTEFVTPTLIAVIWVISVITTIIGCLCMIGMAQQGGDGIVALLTIAIAVISLLYTRIILELIAIFFRMERHQRTIKEILERNEKAAKP